jgi:surface antigen
MAAAPKRQRQGLSDAIKKRIVTYKDGHPNASQETIATLIQQEFNLPVTPGRQTISDVLQNADRWRNLQIADNTTRHDAGSYPALETATVMWLNDKVGQVGANIEHAEFLVGSQYRHLGRAACRKGQRDWSASGSQGRLQVQSWMAAECKETPGNPNESQAWGGR